MSGKEEEEWYEEEEEEGAIKETSWVGHGPYIAIRIRDQRDQRP